MRVINMTEQIVEQAERALEEIAGEADQVAIAEVDPDRTQEMRTPGFSRMVTHTDWNSDDSLVVQQVRDIVDGRIMVRFVGAYEIMNDLYEIVREPEWDTKSGTTKTDHLGFTIWARTNTGAYIEDYAKLTIRKREDLLFKITTQLFDWEQNAADAWGEAMFAKAQWEERFAISFQGPGGRLTIEDRTQHGRLGSRDERYFAIFMSLYSKKADAIVRSMERLGQRLKDTLV